MSTTPDAYDPADAQRLREIARRCLWSPFTQMTDFDDEDTLFTGRGCPRCNQGYEGRLAILETLPMSESVKRIIIDGGSALDIKQQALEESMITLRRCAILNAIRGKTSIEEVLRETTDQ